MTRGAERDNDPEAAAAAPAPPPAILLLAAGKHDAALCGALEAAGFRTDIVRDPKELAAAGYDAVVLRISGGETRSGSPDLLERAERVLAGATVRPVVIVLGNSAGRCPHLVDLELAAGDAAAAARAIGGAIAVRRLQAAEQEIERLRRTVLFARQTAHDLAQPLTTILARAQLLRLNAKPEDPHHRAVNIICDEADRLAKMLEEFQKLKVMAQAPARP